MRVIFWGLKNKHYFFGLAGNLHYFWGVAEKINSGQNEFLIIDSIGLALNFLLIFRTKLI